MLFKRRYWPGLADGSITLAFRRWERPTVRAGGTLRTPAGLLAIDAVERVHAARITDAEARAAGHADAAALRAELDRYSHGAVYRVAFRYVGADPREALRRQDRLDAGERAELQRRLARLDTASGHGPWTGPVLRLIAERPGTRAADLADTLGREPQAFKTDVRKLSALGLTESLEVGYRLSPRGHAVLRGMNR